MMARTGPSAATRARRLLALLHLLERDTTYSLNTIAEMLGTTAPEIAEDLDALACCGVAPYSPDQLMPIFVENGVVEVFGDLPALQHSVRLSANEAHALATALQTAGMAADSPLTARLLQAAAPPGISAEEMERIVRAAASPDTGAALTTVAAGLHERRVVRIMYRSGGASAETERSIEPLTLVAERGVWYTEAFCRRADALRTFRIDRMRSAELTGEVFVPRDLALSRVAFTAENLPLARLRFLAGEEFSTRDWPGARVIARHSDGSFDVDVPFAGTGWIARCVVARLGGIEALAPPEVRASVAELAHSESG